MVLPAKAEMNFDVIYGDMQTSSSPMTATTAGLFTSNSETRNIDYDANKYFAVRTTYWSELQPWFGSSLEISMSNVKGSEAVDIEILSITAQILFRETLFVSDEYPVGRLQLYLGAGLYMVSGSIYADFTPELSTDVEVWGNSIGTGIIAGTRWKLAKKLAIFVEHRTSTIDFKYEGNYIFSSESVNAELSSSYYLLGLSWDL